MIRKLTIVILINLLFSCKEKTSYRMEIFIENSNTDILKVRLFPKVEYLKGDLYDFADLGSGWKDVEFELEPNLRESLFISSDLDLEPNDLVSKIFDSIYIFSVDENQIKIKFLNDTVLGYCENIFTSSSTWIFEIRKYDEPTNFSHNPVESDDYIFKISSDKYLK